MNRPPLALSLIALVLLAGCALKSAQLAPLPPLSGKDVTRLLAAPVREVETLSATGTIKFSQNGASRISDMFLLLSAQHGLRLDFVTPMATPLISAVVGNQSLTLLDFRARKMLTGPANARLAMLLVHFEIDPQLLRQVAAGGFVNEELKWKPAPPANDAEIGRWNFAAKSWRAGLDPETLRPVHLSLAGDDPINVFWDDFRDHGGLALPHRIVIERRNRKQLVVLKLHDAEPNRPIDASLFSPPLPEGWRSSTIKDID